MVNAELKMFLRYVEELLLSREELKANILQRINDSSVLCRASGQCERKLCSKICEEILIEDSITFEVTQTQRGAE